MALTATIAASLRVRIEAAMMDTCAIYAPALTVTDSGGTVAGTATLQWSGKCARAPIRTQQVPGGPALRQDTDTENLTLPYAAVVNQGDEVRFGAVVYDVSKPIISREPHLTKQAEIVKR